MSCKRGLAALLVVFAWGLPCAGSTRALEIQDEMQRRRPVAMSFSPDGRLVAVTVRRLDGFEAHWNEAARRLSDDGIRRSSGQQLLVVETATQRVLYASDPGVSAFDPVWSADGTKLVFCARGARISQVWSWDRDSGRTHRGLDQIAERLMSIRGSSFQLTADARVVAKINRNAKGDLRQRQLPAAESWRPLVFAANMEAAAASKNPPPLASLRFDLGIWDLSSGEHEPIEAGGAVYYASVSPHGGAVAYWRYRGHEEAPRVVYFFDLVVYDLQTKRSRALVERLQIQPMEAAVYWSPDSKKLAYYSHATTGAETLTSRTLWMAQVDAGTPLRLIDGASDNALSGGPVVWAQDSERLFCFSPGGVLAITISSQVVARRLEVPPDYNVKGLLATPTMHAKSASTLWLNASRKADGRAAVLTLEPSSARSEAVWSSVWELPKGAGNPTLSPDGATLLFVQQAVDVPPGLWVLRKSQRTPRPFAGLTTTFDGVQLGKSKLLDFHTSDGVKLQAALLLPPDYDGKAPLPMVVWVYPGRQSRAVDTYGLGGTGPMNAQLLASRGYAVLKPDSLMHDGWPVESLARSILPAVTTAINLGIADPTRIGLWGHSQGGMSVVALLTRSTLFKAAVTSNGYYDLLSFYGSLGADGQDRAAFILEEYNNIFTTPWRNQRVILENSPILNLDRVKTPLLMVVGLGDVSVNASQAEEVYVGLKRLGTKVMLVEYPEATHVPFDWETAQQIDYAQRMIGWFDQYL